jgi:protein SCO1/2
VRVLFLSVDPKRDSLKLLAGYVRAFDPRFVGLRLTGGPLKAFEARYGIFVTYGKPDAEGDYAVAHSGSVYVFGRSGRLRLIGSPANSSSEFASDIAHLLG